MSAEIVEKCNNLVNNELICDVNTDESFTLQEKEVEFKNKPVYDFFKRVFDVVVAVLCLTVGLPFMLIIALAIVIDDFGNPIFVQDRIGKYGKRFRCLKWRTMYLNADEIKVELEKSNEYVSVHFKMSNDPRITRVGKFLRKTSLDETLQAINILLNQMSVIGPRPFIPSEQEQLPDDRLLVKPGLSCYWQIADTTKMSNEDQLELDYKYIRERSFATDIKIIFKTFGVVLGHKNY